MKRSDTKSVVHHDHVVPLSRVEHHNFTVSEDINRLDLYLHSQLPELSRADLQHHIKSGHVHVDHARCTKPSQKLTRGQMIELHYQYKTQLDNQPQSMTLSIIFEDNHLMIIDKPDGLVVHPGAGVPDQTLLNGLLAHHHDAQNLPRAGIVHRLDKNTSGCLLVAKTLSCFHALTQMLSQRTINRYYMAITDGILHQSITVDQPIGRHPVDRKKMAVVTHGKHAVTHVKPIKRLTEHTLIECKLETGRTHQIRVHLANLGHPLIGDPTYGKPRGYRCLPQEKRHEVMNFPRQALHAYRLELTHPITDESLRINSPLPEDMTNLITLLSND